MVGVPMIEIAVVESNNLPQLLTEVWSVYGIGSHP